MMGCSDPNTKSSFGSYRVLSPVAVMDSYAGVIIGAVGLIQVVIMLVLRFCQRVQRTMQLMATVRFPSFFISAALAFHTGTAFASAQLVSKLLGRCLLAWLGSCIAWCCRLRWRRTRTCA